MKRAIGWLAIGAGAMYFLDPRSGRRRRAHARDFGTHLLRLGEDLIGKARVDATKRMQGVRATGQLHLRDAIVRRVWPPALQVGAAALGAGMLSWGTLRGGVLGRLASVGGALLAARGLVNRPLPGLLGLGDGDRGIVVEKAITVGAPIEEAFALWSRFENFPKFMDHVKEVRIHADHRDRSHWVIDAPANTAIWFDAEVVRREPPHVIEWRTLPDQSIEHAGEVRFEAVEGGTRVHVRMVYRPPAGVVGHAIGRVLGFDPKSQMDDDLLRMKSLLEHGKTRAHHHPITIDDVH
jgi:uncharacterized membrane protein